MESYLPWDFWEGLDRGEEQDLRNLVRPVTGKAGILKGDQKSVQKWIMLMKQRKRDSEQVTQLEMQEVNWKVRGNLECHRRTGKPGPGWSGEKGVGCDTSLDPAEGQEEADKKAFVHKEFHEGAKDTGTKT